jgi:hypothetical protein
MRRNLLCSSVLRCPKALALAAGLTVAVASPALAQRAAEPGRLLDRDLRVKGTGLGRPRDFGAEVRLRNSLVTGNAPGGRSLRVKAPYSDPADFRDTLGSSDVFAFRRDSLYSGLGGQGYRGTEGLQYQFGWSTGGSVGRGLTVSALDSGAGREAQGLASTPEGNQTRFATRSWEVAAPVNGAMRSTSAFASTRSLTPTAVGLRQQEDGDREIIAASSLLGLRGIALEERETWNTPLGKVKPTTPGQIAPNSVTPPALTPNPLAAQPAGTRQAASEDAATSSAQRTAYDNLRVKLHAIGEGLDSKKPDPKDAPPVVPPEGQTKPSTPETTKPTDALSEASAWEKRMDALRDSLKSTEEIRRLGDAIAAMDVGTIRAIRRAGQESKTTSGVDEPLGRTNAFAQHIKAGEAFMSAERYFDAEERFTRAITVRPGDASALAARIHSQIGSGLFVSAAVNLRTLAVTRPDAMGMLYSDNLLPSKTRQLQLIQQLRTNLVLDGKPELRVPKESALLLAYLGYQRSEPETVREGLLALEKLATPEERTLLVFLKGVWLDELPQE